MRQFDIVIIGGGMAGASAGYFLAQAGVSAAILERESQPGYHSTGRSAALFSETYGPPCIRKLSTASRSFLEDPPDDFTDYPILTPRGVLMVAPEEERPQLMAHAETAQANGAHVEILATTALRDTVPILREDTFAVGMLERDAMDMDVHALHQGFLRGFKKQEGEVLQNAEVSAIEHDDDGWAITLRNGQTLRAEIIVNAAGAWADEIAKLAGVAPVGLTPKRRTALMVDLPDGVEADEWPLVVGVQEDFYFKPDAGRLLVSPADATPVPAQDVQPEDLDVAIAIDRLMTVTTVEVRRPGESWAGLRSFVCDGEPVVGYADDADGFFWLAGQGGYGIQTAPAMGMLSAALIWKQDIPAELNRLNFDLSLVSPSRELKESPS